MNAETGDERYYEFIGKNSVYPISEIVYPEQREMFLDAFYKAQKGIEDSFLYIKLCDEAGDYYDFLMQLSHNEALVNDVPTVNMTIYEFAHMLRSGARDFMVEFMIPGFWEPNATIPVTKDRGKNGRFGGDEFVG